MIVRREVFKQIGLLDEGYFMYFEEVDFCLRAHRSGWPCWYVCRRRARWFTWSGKAPGLRM